MSASRIRRDRNGYAPSILETEPGICYLCRSHKDTARHEIFFGTGNRKLSKACGLWVNLCPRCHALVHEDKRADEALKRRGFEAYGDREDFYKLFRRYYD